MTQGPAPARSPEVSESNWLEAPHNRWSMWNVRELVSTQRVPHDADAVQELPATEVRTDLDAVPVTRVDGTSSTLSAVLEDTYTDAFAVLQDGRLVGERYSAGGGPDRPHAVLSVSKSLVGCVAGILLERGVLDEQVGVEHYLPELSSSGYAGATVRDLLDMRSGVRFVEDYTDPTADVRAMDDWLLGDQGLYAFLATLGAERPHGGHFLYRSSETDVLGWACERASGVPMATLMSDLVWRPIGAEHDAEIICDRRGTALHSGGFGATARDLLRFGQLLLDGGAVTSPGGESRAVVPPQWLRQAWAVDADVRTAFLESPAEVSFPGGWYRNQFWFRVGEYGDVLLCLGIHGQLVYVSRRTRTVCVKLSSWPDAQNPAFMQDTLRMCDAVSGALTRQHPTGDVHRLRGVVSGLSRGGTPRRPGPTVV